MYRLKKFREKSQIACTLLVLYNEGMTARSFTVETREQAALMLGADTELAHLLTREIKALSLHVAMLSSPAALTELQKTHDPDYLVVLWDEETARWFRGEGKHWVPILEELIQSGATRLILIRHVGAAGFSVALSPVAGECIYTDYIGEDELVSPLLSQWLATAQSEASLEIPGDGLQETSLLSLGDLARGLALAIVKPVRGEGKTRNFGNPETTSVATLAHTLRTSIPHKVSVTFGSSGEELISLAHSEAFAETLSDLRWQLQDDPMKLLTSYLTAVAKHPTPAQVERKTEREVETIVPPQPVLAVLPKEPKTAVKKLTPLRTTAPVFIPLTSVHKPRLTWGALRLPKLPLHRHKSPTPTLLGVAVKGSIIALALYLGSLAFALTVSLLSLKQITASLRADSLPPANGLSRFAGMYLEANWVAFSSLPGISRSATIQEGTLLLDAYNQSLNMFQTAQNLSRTTQDLTHYVLGSGTGDVAVLLSQSRLQVEELYQKLSLLYGVLPPEPPDLIPTRYHASYLSGRDELGELKHTVVTTKALLATVPDLIGLGSRKKYGVLFQNNMELRATGGFIGSFAILSFENGKLYDMPVFDVYAADGQLKGHVEPPGPIKDILGEANWYLRDSNFDPDFPTSARRAEWFIKKTLNQDLDGTIAVNVTSLQGLLQAVGPLTVADYNETITGDNLYERAQFHAEVNFFPGSSQKKEFLSTVGNALFAKLPTVNATEGLKLMAALTQSIEEKNTLISLLDPGAERVLATLNWNGALTDLPCPLAGACQKDYLMVVDSNFGVNKANYFLKRQIEQVITLDKDLHVSHALRLKYTNSSTSTAWPAGQYKNYQRLYLPPETVINSIKIGEEILPERSYTVSTEHNKLVVSYLVTVPISSTLTVEVVYQTGALDNSTPLYTWYWQKQPGTSSDDTLTVYLNYPLYVKPVVISPESELLPQQLKFNFENDTDHRLTVKFSQ